MGVPPAREAEEGGARPGLRSPAGLLLGLEQPDWGEAEEAAPSPPEETRFSPSRAWLGSALLGGRPASPLLDAGEGGVVGGGGCCSHRRRRRRGVGRRLPPSSSSAADSRAGETKAGREAPGQQPPQPFARLNAAARRASSRRRRMRLDGRRRLLPSQPRGGRR